MAPAITTRITNPTISFFFILILLLRNLFWPGVWPPLPFSVLLSHLFHVFLDHGLQFLLLLGGQDGVNFALELSPDFALVFVIIGFQLFDSFLVLFENILNLFLLLSGQAQFLGPSL